MKRGSSASPTRARTGWRRSPRVVSRWTPRARRGSSAPTTAGSLQAAASAPSCRSSRAPSPSCRCTARARTRCVRRRAWPTSFSEPPSVGPHHAHSPSRARRRPVGNASLAESVPLALAPELDAEGWIYEQDYMRDLPYDYTTLVENIIDPSHVPVSHHGTVQGDRNLAQPIATSVSERMPPIGFQGKTEVPLHASSRLSFAQTKAVQTVTFTAPSLLAYRFSVPAGDASALFYPIPVARGRSRILVRRARNFRTERVMRTADLVAKHLENNIVFDQDMAFLCGQEARLQALRADGWGGAWRAKRDSEVGGGRSYVMPAEADRFVISFRKQLDAAAAALPWRSPPLAGEAHAPPMPRTVLLDRYEQHTKKCPTCMAALKLTERLIGVSASTSQVSLMAALVLAVTPAPPLALSLACAAAAAAYSAVLLRAYLVGPIIGALSNRVAAVPLAASAASAAILALAPGGRAARVAAAATPLATALCALYARRALDGLRARFIYTEEAKALQIS
mmetsp:Transcript_49309/g.158417  ORF Transcript_49309/g.158417 Transcript_49309/m.158417 type:complete len:509 (+) Transcript_49309:328-1854(+)